MPLPVRDDQSDLVQEHYAVIYAPGRKRDRFPENCVTLYPTMDEAIQASDTENNLFPAQVVGPSKSSEGLMLFYLARWLD